MNNASQTCHDDSGLLEILATEGKKNGKLVAQRTYQIEKKSGKCFEMQYRSFI